MTSLYSNIGGGGPWAVDEEPQALVAVLLDGYSSPSGNHLSGRGPTVDGAAWYEADGTAH